MDSKRFDDLAKRLGAPATRRTSLRSLGVMVGGALTFLGWRGADEAEAHNALKKCKKKKGKKKKSCIEKAKRHNKKHEEDGNGTVECGHTICPEGQQCCPDERCGIRCCANGRACNQPCSGPNGDAYCCPPDRPVAICNLCFQLGSVACDTPDHCCGPNQVCCGDDHCCNSDTHECRTNCGGVEGSNSCCIKGAGPTCCPQV